MYTNVLMLNAHYVALRVISVRRAFALLVKSEFTDLPLAEVICVENGQYTAYNLRDWLDLSELQHQVDPQRFDWIRSVRTPIAVPRIIRVTRFSRVPRQEVKFNRRNVFARDSHTCQYCGHRFSTSGLSLDHVIPRSQGGGSTWDNVVSSCLRCNVRKGGRTPEQARMRLLTPPTKPKRCPALTATLADRRYAAWKPFLNGTNGHVAAK